ncbi:MAG: hypothetical protein CMP22_05575 [Rickettsiales bacterium]|nr:hypothetical protein [Rickettsiales bacterium]
MPHNHNDHEHDENGNCMGHDHGHDHNHDDESINYPFHHHYEAQRLNETQAQTIHVDWPEYIFHFGQESVEEPYSPALFNFVKDEQSISWLYLEACLDEENDEEIILGLKAVDPDSGISVLGFEPFLDRILENGIHVLLNLPDHGEHAREHAGTILDELSRIWDEDCPTLVIASDSVNILDLAREIMPNQPRCWHVTQVQAENNFSDIDEVIKEMKPSGLIIESALCSEERMNTLLDYEVPVLVMTQDSQLEAKRLQTQGADCLISPFAHILADSL